MVRYRVNHRTTYQYAEPVTHSHNEAQLVPRTLPHQRVIDSRISIHPGASRTQERTDYFGNRLFYFAVQGQHQKLEIVSDTLLEIDPIQNAPAGRNPAIPHSLSWEEAAAASRAEPDLYEFIVDSAHAAGSHAAAEYARLTFTPARPLFECLWELNVRIHTDFQYAPGTTTIGTSVGEVLQMRKGVCQDFTHLALACLRSLGLPGRYVSGYIESGRADARLTGADASHAWFSAYVPGLGWHDFDPTNRKMPEDQHITVSLGRDYADIAPLKGILFGGGASVCRAAVDVLRQ